MFSQCGGRCRRGSRRREPRALLAFQTLGASGRQIFRYVVLPNALPEIFTSVRLSIGIGWTSLIAAELVAGDVAIRRMVMNAGTYLRTDVVMVGILLLGAIGYLLDFAIADAAGDRAVGGERRMSEPRIQLEHVANASAPQRVPTPRTTRWRIFR